MTRCLLFYKKASILFRVKPEIPLHFNLSKSRLCGTLSKDFSKTERIKSTGQSLSKLDEIKSIVSNKFVVQDLFLKNPCFYSESQLKLYTKFSISVLMNLHVIHNHHHHSSSEDWSGCLFFLVLRYLPYFCCFERFLAG